MNNVDVNINVQAFVCLYIFSFSFFWGGGKSLGVRWMDDMIGVYV